MSPEQQDASSGKPVGQRGSLQRGSTVILRGQARVWPRLRVRSTHVLADARLWLPGHLPRVLAAPVGVSSPVGGTLPRPGQALQGPRGVSGGGGVDWEHRWPPVPVVQRSSEDSLVRGLPDP